MASVKEITRKGSTSYCITVMLGRDAAGKQIRKYRTWIPPADLTPARARKQAQIEADRWEEELKSGGSSGGQTAEPSPPPVETARVDDFCVFVRDVWLPAQVQSKDCKPTTAAFYGHMIKLITAYFAGDTLQAITPERLQQYLYYLRTNYRTKQGKPMSAKSVRHQYTTLGTIFAYADKHGYINKNPMKLKSRSDTFHFDCRKCGRCCRKRSEPILINGADAFRMARALGVSIEQAIIENTAG